MELKNISKDTSLGTRRNDAIVFPMLAEMPTDNKLYFIGM